MRIWRFENFEDFEDLRISRIGHLTIRGFESFGDSKDLINGRFSGFLGFGDLTILRVW